MFNTLEGTKNGDYWSEIQKTYSFKVLDKREIHLFLCEITHPKKYDILYLLLKYYTYFALYLNKTHDLTTAIL